MTPTLTIGPRYVMNAPTLPTLGGTALEAEQTPLPPVPGHVWGLMALAVVVLCWSARRPRETSAAARVPAPGRGRSQPYDEVLLAECA